MKRPAGSTAPCAGAPDSPEPYPLERSKAYPQHIVVTAWSPVWTERFAQEAAAIRRILGANCAAVHHIGSTAVPGLCAKPIIDILPVVYDLSLTDAAQAAFERIGYEYLGEFGIPGRRYLRKGGDERTHQIHIFA